MPKSKVRKKKKLIAYGFKTANQMLEYAKIQSIKNGRNLYLVMPDKDLHSVNLDKRIIIESMVKDIEESDELSDFLHVHQI